MSKKFIVPIFISLVLITNLFLGFSRLDKYSAVDEPYWTYGRISKFWTAIRNHDWKETNINDKPGITVALLSKFGLYKYDPMQYEHLREQPKTDQQLSDIRNINFHFRLPIFLFCTFMLLFFYFLLRRLLGYFIALISFIFIGFSPIIFGISLIINPDSLLWVFLPLSLLSYLVYQKDQKKAYLLLGGIFLGLSLLTKYVANILYVFFLILPFLEYIFLEDKPAVGKYLKKSLIDYLALIGISVLVYFALYPATWINLKILLEGTFLSQAFEKTWPLFAVFFALIGADAIIFKNKFSAVTLNFLSKYKSLLVQVFSGFFLFGIALVLVNTYSGMRIFDFVELLSSPKGIGDGNILQQYSKAMLTDIYSLIFGLCPLALLAFILALSANLKKNLAHKRENILAFYFIIFIIFYYFASSVNDVIATVRYQIILYPLALIISAIGISQIFSIGKIKKYVPDFAAIIFVFIFSLAAILFTKPFYFAYASPLLPERYLLNYKDMGDGSYEAAQYLNSLPDARNLSIWSDKGAVCAEFVGKCSISYQRKELKNEHFDYVVASTGRRSKASKMSEGFDDFLDLKKAYETENYAKKIIIGGREENYVKIVSTENL